MLARIWVGCTVRAVIASPASYRRGDRHAIGRDRTAIGWERRLHTPQQQISDRPDLRDGYAVDRAWRARVPAREFKLRPGTCLGVVILSQKSVAAVGTDA